MKTELKNEIATTRDGRDITRGFVDSLPLLPPQDRLLQLKGGGDLLVYQEVLRDEQVKACVEQRFRGVISRPWEVVPGGDKRIDKQAAVFIREQIDALNFDAITEKMLYGVFYGYAVAEALWDSDGSRIVLKDIRVRDRRRFGFAPDMTLRLKTSQKPLGEALPDKKFWSFCVGADHDDEPYGLGLAHWLYWPVFFKRSGIRFWLTYLEKFGTPTLAGEYPQGTPEEDQNKLLQSLRDARQDSALVMPEGMKVNLLEATRAGSADYTELYERMDAAIARATLGQTASTQGTPGRLGNDDLQGDVRLDIVKADADLVCMSLNATIVRWLTEWNFPGAALPQVWRIVEEAEDLKTRADRDSTITGMGFKPSLKYIADTYGGEWTEKEAQPPINPQINPQPDTGGTAFAENVPASPMQAEEDQLATEADGYVEQMMATITTLVNDAKSLSALQTDLVAAFADLDSDDLVEVMAAAFALAHIKGLVEVQDNG
ncbi:MAG: DUF935 domain-containing protein [Methylobacillus sp.]|jgi:phage gp29-like protein|nr:DUF935 domain-containing protein [Methylobacillus sp.]